MGAKEANLQQHLKQPAALIPKCPASWHFTVQFCLLNSVFEASQSTRGAAGGHSRHEGAQLLPLCPTQTSCLSWHAATGSSGKEALTQSSGVLALVVIPQSTTAALGLPKSGLWTRELESPSALRLQACQGELGAEPSSPTLQTHP